MISSDLDKSRFFVGRDFGTAWVLVARKSGSDSLTVVFLLACCHEQHCQHMMEPTVTCPSALILIFRAAAALLAKRKSG